MSSDPRRQPLPSSSTSRPFSPSSEDNNITWLDFLRTAGGTVPSDRSNSADRKRRHTGASPERRAIPHHPVYTTRRPWDRDPTVHVAGSSRENAIDLTARTGEDPLDRPAPPTRRPPVPQWFSGSNENLRESARSPISRPTMANFRGSFSGRRDSSEIVLPRWQPDADVNRCPVCQAEFSFWYRKHHCRKCGRVVCAACSPHRITIPRQYIVQQPTSSDGERSPSSPTNTPYQGYLGGGEVVRVCKPCVPDPWTPDTASDAPARGVAEDRGRRDGADVPQRPDRYRPVPPPPPFNQDRTRAQPNPPTPNYSRSLPQGQTPPAYVFRQSYNRPPPPPPTQSHPTNIRHPQGGWRIPAHLASPPFPSVRPPVPPPPPTSPPAAPPSAPPQRQPRRQIREEDECPVCGNELPPGENLREAHIQECIASRFSSTPSTSGPPVPARSSSIAATGVTTTTSIPTASNPDPSTQLPQPNTDSTRPRATSYRPRGMAIYRATEKDCMTEDGEPQECVICFEEFQPGDEMGRMECLCKFHRICIRAWWDTKGNGVCPTHMLHE